MTKTCPRCSVEKNIEHFAWKDQAKGRRASECRPCHAEMRRAYYRNNGSKERSAIYARRRDFKDWLREIKNSLSCEECGENHPATLDFHHRDQAEKIVEISKVVGRRGWGKPRIEAEIAKCRVLCSNCHRKVHWDEEAGRPKFHAD